MLRVFGFDAYFITSKNNRTKFDTKVKKCVFLSYQREIQEYRLCYFNACKLIVSRNVSFNESKSLNEEKIV